MPRKTSAKIETPAQAEFSAEAKPEQKKSYRTKVRRLEPHTLVEVRNGFNGVLVYVSPRTGERFVWDSFGTVLDMELQDLRTAKSAHKEFFSNNWFMIEDHEILVDLGVERMYRDSLTMSNFDDLFAMTADEIKQKLAVIPEGQKQSVAYRAKQLIEEGKIDSIKVINVLESCLGIELIER